MDTEPPAPATAAADATSFAVLLFTDICDSTALKAQHGALVYRTAAELHNRAFEQLAAEEKLTLIKNTGDGYFARTASVAAAVRFALRLQDALRAMAWPDFPLFTRVGIHAGEVADITTLGQTDVLAPAADLVARIMSLASGGQILLSRWPFDEARHFVRSHPAVESGEPLALTWLAHGPYLFKGCEEPVEIFEVGAPGFAPLTAPPDAEKARRAVRPGEEETLGWRPAIGLEVPGRTGWLLVRKIGEGGFGEVWLAEQAKIGQRRVFKFCFDENRLRSFKRELTFFRLIRDVLGEREDIARLYDVKLDEPPFFLESEFAEHGNLVEWGVQQGGIGAVPIERRLDIVAHVAEAVAAAHSVGILHKDLKPQNVLMQARAGGDDAPQLTDFGIGALVDRTALAAHDITAAGFTMMTLPGESGHGSGSSMTRLYAPPEQLTGKTYTVQGDVYALGVILYQIAVGDFARALAPGWERDVDDALLREDIAACVDGDPARRLTSAAELAERLRTLPARHAERSADQRTAARIARRRRRTRLAVGAAVVLALAVAALGVGFLRERGLRKRADLAEHLAESRRGDAEKARDAAENLINEAIYGLRKKLLAVGKIDVLEDMVAAADGYYKSLPPELLDDDAQMHLVSLALNRATIAEALGHDVESERFVREALDLGEKLAARHPDRDKLQEEICYAQLTLCYLFMDRNDSAAVMKGADTVVTRCEAALKVKPDALWALHYSALAHGVAGQALTRYIREPAQGLARFQLAADLAKRMREIGGETAEVCEVEGFVHYGNGNVAGKLGQADRELSEFEASAASFARALELGGDSALLREMHLGALHHVGMYGRRRALERHDPAEAQRFEEIMRQVLEGRRKLVELEPARAEWWRDLAHSHGQINKCLADKGDIQGAVQSTRDELGCRDEAIKRQPNRPLLHDERFSTLTGLANLLLKSNPSNPKEAAEYTVAALVEWRRAIEMADFSILLHSGIEYEIRRLRDIATRDPVAGVGWLVEARDTLKPLLDKINSKNDLNADYITLLRCMEENFTKLGRAEEAAAATTELKKYEDTPEFLREEYRQTWNRAAQLHKAFRDAPDAEKAARLGELQTHVRRTNEVSSKYPNLLPASEQLGLQAAVHSILGDALVQDGNFVAGETALSEAIRINLLRLAAERIPINRAMIAVRTYEYQAKRADALRSLGRGKEAVELRRAAAEATEKIASETSSAEAFAAAATRWKDFALKAGGTEREAERMSALTHATEMGEMALKLEEAAGDLGLQKKSVMHEAGWAWCQLGSDLCGLKKWSEAEHALSRARALAEASAKRSDSDPFAARLLAETRTRLAALLVATARAAEGLAELELVETEMRNFLTRTGAEDSPFRTQREEIAKVRARVK